MIVMQAVFWGNTIGTAIGIYDWIIHRSLIKNFTKRINSTYLMCTLFLPE